MASVCTTATATATTTAITTATTIFQATDSPTFNLTLSPSSPRNQKKSLDSVDSVDSELGDGDNNADLSRSSSSSSSKSDSTQESGHATDSGSNTSLDEEAIKAGIAKRLALDLEQGLPSPALSIASSGNSEYFDADGSPFAMPPTCEIMPQDLGRLHESTLKDYQYPEDNDNGDDAIIPTVVPTVIKARRRFSLMSASSLEEQDEPDNTPRFAVHQGIDTLAVYEDEYTRPSTSQGLSSSFFRKSTLMKKVASSVSLAGFSHRKHGRSVSIDEINRSTLKRSESTFTLSGRLHGIFTTVPPLPTKSSAVPPLPGQVQEIRAETRPTLSPFQRIRRSFSISERRKRAVPVNSSINEPLPPQEVVPPMPASSDIPISSTIIQTTVPPSTTPQRIPPPRTHSLKHLSIHTHGFTTRIQRGDLQHGDLMPPSPKQQHLTPPSSPLYQLPTASSSATSLQSQLLPLNDKQQNRLSTFIPPQRKESLAATIPWRKSASTEQVAARRRTVHDDVTPSPTQLKDASKYDLFALATEGTKQRDPVARLLQVRKFIARETCLTEKSYLHQLVILHDQYYLTLLNSVTIQSKNLLPVLSLAGMFEHLPMLIAVSKEISDALSQCWVNPRPRDIARAFLDRIEMIEAVFVNYARGYAKGFELIRRARRSRRRGWERWMREAREQGEIEIFVRATSPTTLSPVIPISTAISEPTSPIKVIAPTKAIVAPLSPMLGSGVTPSADAALRRLTIEDLLVAPLQRITRYVLLLKDLRKHTVLSDTVGESDVEAIRAAHHAMERIALKCDQLQSEREESKVESNSSRVSIAIAI